MSSHIGTPGKFTTGSTMRHVMVMTLTGSLGLSFMFLVDFLALFWISRLNDEVLITAVGFAGVIQFFVVSVAMGMMIGAVALVSRALGRGDQEEARRIAGSAMVYAIAVQTVIATTVFVFRRPLLAWSGAEGEALDVAVQFLTISLPSLPMIAAGMTASAVLRAAGDAWRSMLVTTSAGLVALVVDPLLIIWMGLGVPGAAIAIIISRSVMVSLGLYWAIKVRKLLGRPSLPDLRHNLPAFIAIAGPAVATTISTPFGNWVLTRAMAEHGDSAVAGLGVTMRMTILAFGGIFALSGAIGGIIGQNYGAGLPHRVASAYRDALIFCAGYTMVVWAVLVAMSDPVSRTFGLGPEGAEVVHVFARVSGFFLFTGALFVSNAAFNNLGKPFWATAANWTRDGVLIFPLAMLFGAWMGASGVVVGQAVANTIAGIAAAWVGWRFVQRMGGARAPQHPVPDPVTDHAVPPM